MMIAMLGVPTYGIRACARVRDDKLKLTKVAHELLFITIIMSAFAYILFGISLFVVPRLFDDRLLYIITSSTILLNAIGMEWLFKALEQYTFITIRSVVFKAIAAVAMFLLIHQKSDYVIYGIITVFASSASFILNFIHAGKYIRMRPVGGYDLRPHLKPVMVFFAMACATTIYTNLDTVMLGFMRDNTEVGYYNAAVKIKLILMAIVTSLGNVLLPRVSYFVQKGMKEEFNRVCAKSLNFVFLLATPLVLYFIIFAKEGIFLLSGAAFEGSVVPMQIIMPTVLFIGLTGIMGIQVLVPLGLEKYVLYSEIAGAVIDLILNWLLIPKLGASGAAIGTLVAEIVVFIVQWIVLRKRLAGAFKAVSYLRILAGLAAGTAACVWIKFISLGSFITLLISGVLFFGLYYAILLLTREGLTVDITRQAAGVLKSKLGGKKRG